VFKGIIHAQQLFYKIKSVKKEDIIYVYIKIKSKGIFTIIGLNWIILGFVILFAKREYKKGAMEKINELGTTILDPHAYYNISTIIGGNTALLKHKLNIRKYYLNF
jgi:hypothetical protein